MREVSPGDVVLVKVARIDPKSELPVSYEIPALVVEVDDTYIAVMTLLSCVLCDGGTMERNARLTLERNARLDTWRHE